MCKVEIEGLINNSSKKNNVERQVAIIDIVWLQWIGSIFAKLDM